MVKIMDMCSVTIYCHHAMQITHACAVTTLMRMRVIDIPYVTLRSKHIHDVDT